MEADLENKKKELEAKEEADAVTKKKEDEE